ncbi:PHP domain-containing protein [Bacillus sp. AK128]
MNIDFHTHVKISKKSEFMPEYFQEMMKEAKAAGLNAIALTEHFNTNNFMDVYNYLNAHYPYYDDYYYVEGLKVFPGMEVDVKEIGHILIISNKATIFDLFEQLIPHLEENNFISFEDLLNLAESPQTMIIGGHPFRQSTPLTQHDPLLLKRLDALDLNGKDLHSIGIEENKEKVYAFAESLKLPVVAGSDTHQFLQYGSVLNELSEDYPTVIELKKAIQSKAYTIHISSDLHLKVRSAKITKKLIKKLLSTTNELIIS